MKNIFKNIFKTKPFLFSDLDIYKVLGTKIYIRNGCGYGFISDSFLYDNEYLEIGFGRTRSGYGDWGGGFSHATTCPLTIVIDRNFNIIKTDTDSFYNSDNSKIEENKAKKLIPLLSDKLIVKNENLLKTLKIAFKTIPVKKHIGIDIDIENEYHDLKYIRDEKANELKWERKFAQEAKEYGIEE